MGDLRNIFHLLSRRQRLELFWLQMLVIVVSFFELLGVASIAPFMAVVAQPSVIQSNMYLHRAYEIFSFSSEMSFLKALGIAIFALMLFSNVLIFSSNWLLVSFGAKVGRTISVDLYESYLRKSYLFHTQSNSAVLSKNIFQEVLRVTNNVIIQFLTLVSKLVTVLFISLGLLWVQPVLTTISIVALGGGYVSLYFLIRQRLLENGADISYLLGSAMKAVNEGLGGIKDVKLHQKENFYVRVFDRVMSRFTKLSIYNSAVPLIPRYALEVIIFGGIISSFLYFIGRGTPLAEFLPILSIFAVAGMKLMPALQQIFSSLTTMRANMNSLHIVSRDLADLALRRPAQVLVVGNEKSFEQFEMLAARDISFSYPGARAMAVRNLSFEIKRNTTNAFVGVSGSGKSTLVDLIAGLLVPDSGAFSIGGVGLDADNVGAWRTQIGYVPQSVYLIDGSFKENIAFGENEETVDLERVETAAQLAQLHDFIQRTPIGYDTTVGERGIQLSGGQRQRIGIARALYANPALLIFDEATSALDTLTEREIMSAIENMKGSRTILLIAHRLSTVRNCHEIFLMQNGQIQDRGSYKDLLNQSQLFREMAQMSGAE